MSALVFIFHLELMYRYQTHKRIPSLPECGLKMTIGNLLLMMIMSFLVFKLFIKLEIFHVVLYWFYQALVFFMMSCLPIFITTPLKQSLPQPGILGLIC